jgi:hypothetical protein
VAARSASCPSHWRFRFSDALKHPMHGCMRETFHVVPTEDWLDHEEIQDACVCGPHVEFFPRGKVVVHHALDGRHVGDPSWARRRAGEVAADKSLCEDLLN